MIDWFAIEATRCCLAECESSAVPALVSGDRERFWGQALQNLKRCIEADEVPPMAPRPGWEHPTGSRVNDRARERHPWPGLAESRAVDFPRILGRGEKNLSGRGSVER